MHWDVVEVKPEPGYRLFVRFKDGLAGRVQLRQEELTGALAPLLDNQFFEQVFIDCGAVAWPGEIDLAPDAMYAQVASKGRVHIEVFRSQLPRFYELKDLSDPSNKDAYFQNFEDHLQDETCFRTFVRWEENLQGLDAAAWTSLKSKACTYLNRNKKGRGWQQFFNVLGEACGYNYLGKYEGCSAVRFIPESNDRTPDLEGVRDHERVLCEVKTINISDEEVRARRVPSVVRKLSNQLEEGFFGKIDSDIACAKSQLDSYDPHGDAQHLVYINICFDDLFALYKEDYFQQIQRHLLEHPPEIKVAVSLDVSKTEAQVVGQPGNKT
jgi:Protein of unknown function (DUF2442)